MKNLYNFFQLPLNLDLYQPFIKTFQLSIRIIIFKWLIDKMKVPALFVTHEYPRTKVKAFCQSLEDADQCPGHPSRLGHSAGID
jgi:hypothetical protein